MRERQSVRVLLISPQNRMLLFKYRNSAPNGTCWPCWSTAGGGRDPGETIEQTAVREVFEETGISDVRLGPIDWYGEDNERCGNGQVLFKEHFIVAFAPSEGIDRSLWTDWENTQITDTRWWSVADLKVSTENIFPRNLGVLLQPILVATTRRNRSPCPRSRTHGSARPRASCCSTPTTGSCSSNAPTSARPSCRRRSG